jgi:tRNA(Ile)-lysidine synthetase-like protein
LPSPSTVERFRALRREPDGRLSVVEQGTLRIARSMRMLAFEDSESVLPPESKSTGDVENSADLELNGMRLRIRKLQQKPPAFDDRTAAFLDAMQLRGTLTLRTARPGDRYQPLGLRGSKKLSDLFTERRVPAFQRAHVPVLTDDNGILWPIGCPVAERARITPSTRTILCAEVLDTQTSEAR